MTYATLLDPAEVPDTLYKIVGPNGEPLHGGSGAWPLPDGDTPGEWWDIPAEDVQACRVGLHVTDAAHLAGWVPTYGDPVIYRAETRGPVWRVGDGDKYVCASVRLLPRKPRRGPDVATLYARRDRVLARTGRRKVRAERALTRAIGPAWAEYARRLGWSRLGYAPAAVADAVTRYTAECNAADADANAAIRRCSAAVGRAMMPD